MIVVKIRDIVYDEKLLQQLYLKKQLYGLYMNEGIIMLDQLNFFNKVNEEDKVLILLNSLPESYDYIVTTMLYGKETLILEDVTPTLCLIRLGGCLFRVKGCKRS